MPNVFDSKCDCDLCQKDLEMEDEHGIAGFIHCKQCTGEDKRDKIAVGVSLDHRKLIVICETCDKLVVQFDL